MQSDFDNNLLDYFTDVEHLRGAFKEYVAAPVLPKRLMVIHGVGGVGKSSLLRMFRIHCKSVKVPVALASGDDTKSVLDALTRWMDDLKVDGIKFAALGKTLETYRAIQAKVDEQAKKAQDGRGRVADIAGKAASKTAESAGGALLGAAIGSVVPGVGTAIGGALGGVLGGMGADALVDWLRGFLSKPDIDLLLDPSKRLTDDFLADLAKAAEKRRMVLMLDTFEQMSVLDDWARDVAQRLHPNVLMVIAGRKLPDWNRLSPGWMMNAHIEELKPMSEEIMRELIGRYYATMRGGQPEAAQVEAIIRFARGLPMVVTSAVQLWVKYGVEDFQSVKAEIVANLVDRLMEGVPNTLIPALEAAAAVRWFDQPILRAVTGLEDVRDIYNELRRFPFVRARVEGLALHDSVRELMDENLHVQDSERHCELHERAAGYFERQLQKTTTVEIDKYEIERIYHWLLIDENKGTQIFTDICKDLVSAHLVGQLGIVIGDIKNHSFTSDSNRLWFEYYNACLAQLEVKGESAEKSFTFLAEQEAAEPRLSSYVNSDLGNLLSKWQNLGKPGGFQRAVSILEKSISVVPLDNHLVNSHFSLAHAYQYVGDWKKSLQHLKLAEKFYADSGNKYGLAYTHSHYMVMYMHMGNLKSLFEHEAMVREATSKLPKYSFVRAQINAFSSVRLLLGRFAESEKSARDSLSILRQIGDTRSSLEPMRWLSWALALQGKYDEANKYCDEHLILTEQSGDYYVKDAGHGKEIRGLVLILQGKYKEAEVQLIQSLKIKEKVREILWIPTTVSHLALCYEMQNNWNMALQYYQKSIALNTIGRLHSKSEALAGILRVKCRLGDSKEFQTFISDAKAIAETNEFNDHLASLCLTQGHLKSETSDISKGFVITQFGNSDAPSQNQQSVMNNNYENAVFVSYAWGGESERIAGELEQAFADRSIRVIRDKKDLGYKGSIEAFEQRMAQGQCIVLIISDKYLRSEHCMYELVEMGKNRNLRDCIFPIVLGDAQIYKAIDRLSYIKHWDTQIEQLNQAIKQVGVITNLAGITANLDRYASIRASFDHLTDLLSDMNALTPEMHASNGFSTLIGAVEHAMAENTTISTRSSGATRPHEISKNSFEQLQDFGSLSVLDDYKQAMIYALRYNRFLLDELLSGRPQGTPLRPIIPWCLERDEVGRKILLALRDWWQTGLNDTGTPRPDSISPIPEGIPLLEAEKLAREREPGDGSAQKSVLEQIDAVL
jgi:tetratricopeptide (TPR) repeat protein